MSAAEMLLEKAKGLTESQAEVVMRCIDAVRGPSPKPSELMRMPREVREQIMASQFADAERIYRENPELIMEDTEAPLEYE
jgi:hypothetical protein